MIDAILPHVIPGLLYGIGAIGLAIVFRFLKFPDFTSLGSIMVGGIVSVWVTLRCGPFVGIAAGATAGAILGAATGFLVRCLQIQPVVAGIITFTGSLTIGYLFTNGGTIDLPPSQWGPFHSGFCLSDAIIVAVIVLVLIGIGIFIIQTKFGSLVLAMTAGDPFLRFRHRHQTSTFVAIVILGNSLVALAGSLHAMYQRQAWVVSHTSFLPFSLGAIFGGNALAAWLLRALRKFRGPVPTETHLARVSAPDKALIALTQGMVQDESKALPIQFVLYVVGCLFFSVITGLVNANAFKSIHPILNVPTNFEHLVGAILITFFVWWATPRQK